MLRGTRFRLSLVSDAGVACAPIVNGPAGATSAMAVDVAFASADAPVPGAAFAVPALFWSAVILTTAPLAADATARVLVLASRGGEGSSVSVARELAIRTLGNGCSADDADAFKDCGGGIGWKESGCIRLSTARRDSGGMNCARRLKFSKFATCATAGDGFRHSEGVVASCTQDEHEHHHQGSIHSRMQGIKTELGQRRHYDSKLIPAAAAPDTIELVAIATQRPVSCHCT